MKIKIKIKLKLNGTALSVTLSIYPANSKLFRNTDFSARLIFKVTSAKNSNKHK